MFLIRFCFFLCSIVFFFCCSSLRHITEWTYSVILIITFFFLRGNKNFYRMSCSGRYKSDELSRFSLKFYGCTLRTHDPPLRVWVCHTNRKWVLIHSLSLPPPLHREKMREKKRINKFFEIEEWDERAVKSMFNANRQNYNNKLKSTKRSANLLKRDVCLIDIYYNYSYLIRHLSSIHIPTLARCVEIWCCGTK